MPKPFAFISYRRADSRDWAAKLYEAMIHAFGPDAVFMDVDSIRAGDNWPARIEKAAEDATLMLPVIGTRWLFVQDEAGRRRIDLEDDWVRREILQALETGTTMFGVLVDGAKMPSASSLPPPIDRLNAVQSVALGSKDDLARILADLEARFGFRRIRQELEYPSRVDTSPELSAEELQSVLAELSQWSIIRRPVERATGGVSEELIRVYKFRTYTDAMHFIMTASRFVNRIQRHPLWESQYKDLRVSITTWDIGHRISFKDVRLAKYLEKLFLEYAVK